MLSAWYLSEWEPYYGRFGPGDARADLEARCNHDKVPLGLVAMEGNDVCGTAALDLDPATNLTPSVVGLLVRRDRRGRGIATALLESAEGHARRLGYGHLYMSTNVLGHLLLRLGWQPFREVEFLNNEQGSIYKREL
ncbi:MAG: GNAT family N-acetyltransferase [Geminicoccaceae bacterium]